MEEAAKELVPPAFSQSSSIPLKLQKSALKLYSKNRQGESFGL